MNLNFLGDALDFWKGCLFNRLTSADLLQDLKVESLLTDHQAWQEPDFALYAELLEVGRQAIDPPDERAGDLFLDPDIGVQTSRVSVANRVKYVTPSKVAHLANASPRHVVAVYQHVRGRQVLDRVSAVVATLQRVEPGLSLCSVESGTVAMVFTSRDAERVAHIYQHFHRLFRNTVPYRTHLWPVVG